MDGIIIRRNPGKGDLVTFPKGMSCVWEIHGDVKKHYRFD
jgi:uncharacterized cupin superfamily protein